MNYCVNCGTKLPETPVNHCPNCGQKIHSEIPGKTLTPKSRREAALIVLCILTILGSILGILKGLALELVYDGVQHSFPLNRAPYGYFSVLFNVGTLTAALIMLTGKKRGYTLYLWSQSANILVVLLWLFIPTISGPEQYGDFVYSAYQRFNPLYILLAATTVIPSIVFMVLYSALVKKHLG